MKKIISLFQRNFDKDHLITDAVTIGAEWVVNGEGYASRKWDGTACMVRDGVLYKRYDAKHGKELPPGFEPAQGDADPITGHFPGWLALTNRPEEVWHYEAFFGNEKLPNGTYELVGPKINGNPESIAYHVLKRHGHEPYDDCPRSFAELRDWLSVRDIEGIVWHAADGRMVKVKKKDFGLRRKP